MDELEIHYRRACERVGDFREHLPTLRRYAEQCSHVTEFGVREVCSTWALLAARPARVASYDLWRHPAVDDVVRAAGAAGVAFRFREANTVELRIEPTDLLFIDTWHTRRQLAAELGVHAPRVRRYILLHDTVTFGFFGEDGGEGLLPALFAFLDAPATPDGRPEWYVKEHFTNCHGLTVLERSEFKSVAAAQPVFREPRVDA